jgi:hypothetical protein
MSYNAMRKNNVIGRKFVERKCVKAECTCTSHRPNILHLISPYLLLAERLGHLADALAGRTRARVLELPLPRCCVKAVGPGERDHDRHAPTNPCTRALTTELTMASPHTFFKPRQIPTQQDEINAFANISVVLLRPFPSCSYLRSSRLPAVVSPDYLPTSITSCSYYCSPRAPPRSLHHFLFVIVINSYVFLPCFCACSYHRSLRAATIVDSSLVLP